MTAIPHPQTISLEDYLSAEATAPCKSEYLAGQVHAIAGSTAIHNQIAGALYSALRSHLRGRPCRAYISDMKVKISFQGLDTVYYPDVLVDCSPLPPTATLTTSPTLIAEVLSDSTARIDQGEKALLYRHIPALQDLLLISSSHLHITHLRRCANWQPLILNSPSATLHLPSLSFHCTLADIYSGTPLLP